VGACPFTPLPFEDYPSTPARQTGLTNKLQEKQTIFHKLVDHVMSDGRIGVKKEHLFSSLDILWTKERSK